jgi:hypothetical protein
MTLILVLGQVTVRKRTVIRTPWTASPVSAEKIGNGRRYRPYRAPAPPTEFEERPLGGAKSAYEFGRSHALKA